MDTTELYKLPKDILVKLITTIQEQTREEVKKECSDQMRNVFEKMHNYDMTPCFINNCDKYKVHGTGTSILYSNSEFFSSCYRCTSEFCKEHLQYIKELNGENYCEDCYEYLKSYDNEESDETDE